MKISTGLNNIPPITFMGRTVDVKTIALPVASIIFGLILLVLILIPQTIDFFKTQSTIIELQNKVIDLEAKSKILESISIQTYEDELSTTLKALPAERDYIVATALLQSLAASSNVQLLNINFNDGQSAYQIKTDVSGGLNDLKDFISKVNNAPRVMKIQGIDLVPDKASTYNASLSINAVLAPVSKESIQVDQPVVELSNEDLASIENLSKSLDALTNLGSGNTGTQRFNSRTDPF